MTFFYSKCAVWASDAFLEPSLVSALTGFTVGSEILEEISRDKVYTDEKLARTAVEVCETRSQEHLFWWMRWVSYL